MDNKVTVKQAAKQSGLGERTIFQYLRDEKLTRYQMGTRTMVDLEELDIVLSSKGHKVLNHPQVMARALRQIEVLQRQVDLLLYLGEQGPASDMSDEQMARCYDTVIVLWRKDSFGTKDVDTILGILSGITDTSLESLMLTRDELHPWRPFYLIAGKAQSWLKARKDFGSSVDLRETFHKITHQRKRLRDIASVFIASDMSEDNRSQLLGEVGPANTLESEVLRRICARKPSKAYLRRDPVVDIRHVLDFLMSRPSPVVSVRDAAKKLRDAASTIEDDTSEV